MSPLEVSSGYCHWLR